MRRGGGMVLWKTSSLAKFYQSLEISRNLLGGLRVSDFVSVVPIKSLHFFVSGSDFKMPVSASRIYHSPPLL